MALHSTFKHYPFIAKKAKMQISEKILENLKSGVIKQCSLKTGKVRINESDSEGEAQKETPVFATVTYDKSEDRSDI